MQQIKTFEYSQKDEDVNAWLTEHPEINILRTERIPMYDRYNFGQGDICNQWVDVVITYEIRKNEL